jgi:branched-chain amino acid aminotransferase
VFVYLNGELVPEAEAAVSVYDSGLNFADGVFEGIRVYAGRVFRLERHLERLFASARAFEIEIGMSADELAREILRWLRANGVRDGYHFRPIVTRGDRIPPRLDPRFCTGGPRVLFVGGPAASASLGGVRAVLSGVRRTAPDALDPRVKSLSYGNHLLARLDALRRGADDALMLDDRGHLCEATAANVFVVRDGRLATPTTRACLSGITRQAVLELAGELGLATEEVDLAPEAVSGSDEIFLTGTGAEVTPVVALDGRPVGDGAAGPLTRRLAAAYGALVRSEGVPIDASAAE